MLLIVLVLPMKVIHFLRKLRSSCLYSLHLVPIMAPIDMLEHWLWNGKFYTNLYIVFLIERQLWMKIDIMHVRVTSLRYIILNIIYMDGCIIDGYHSYIRTVIIKTNWNNHDRVVKLEEHKSSVKTSILLPVCPSNALPKLCYFTMSTSHSLATLITLLFYNVDITFSNNLNHLAILQCQHHIL